MTECHEYDAAVAMSVFVPVHSICKPQEGRDVDAMLLGNLSDALPCWRTHSPSHISFVRLAVTPHCPAPSSPLVGGTGRVGEALTFLTEGGGGQVYCVVMHAPLTFP